MGFVPTGLQCLLKTDVVLFGEALEAVVVSADVVRVFFLDASIIDALDQL